MKKRWAKKIRWKQIGRKTIRRRGERRTEDGERCKNRKMRGK
jgi:hypothetical protein